MSLYTKQELKVAKTLYQDCGFISKKTQSIYAWRAATWVRYCKEKSMDHTVTEDKLIDYIDWLFSIDFVHNTNTKKTYVPDILRDYMGSLICLWRIQTNNNPDLIAPKEGVRYQAKWEEILRRYPRQSKYQPNSNMIEGSARGMAMSPTIQPSQYSGHVNGRPATYYSNSQYRYQPPPQQQQQQQQQPVYSPYYYYNKNIRQERMQQQQSLLQDSYPVGISETTELDWQLGWLQRSGSVSFNSARCLFTLGMSTWANAAHFTSLQLGDLRFSSTAMAPRLPSSLLRVSLSKDCRYSLVPPLGPSNRAPVGNTAAWYQFSIIRSRNPLMCSLNAVAMTLFYKWVVARSPPPTFSNSNWQNIPVIPIEAYGSTSPPESIDSQLHSPSGREYLTRMLLPADRIPMERVIRDYSFQYVQRSGACASSSGNPLDPLTDSESPDRLGTLCQINNGYYENYHTIQRHKVIPSDTLKHMLFPWADTLMATAPNDRSIDDRRCCSRFVDFISEMRIVILQDIAVIKCCHGPAVQNFETTSILEHPLFSTPEFLQYCDRVRDEAAEDIRLLQKDLDRAVRNWSPPPSAHQTGLGGYSLHPAYQHHPKNHNISGNGVVLPPISSPALRRDSGSGTKMAIGSPEDEADHEMFSPDISSSPPAQSSLFNSTRVEEPQQIKYSPRSLKELTPVVHKPGTSTTQQGAEHSHSVPLQIAEGGYFSSGINSSGSGNTSSNSIVHGGDSSKRPPVECGYSHSSPRIHHRSLFTQNTSPRFNARHQPYSKSPPQIGRSPDSTTNVLPPISQFAQSTIAAVKPTSITTNNPHHAPTVGSGLRRDSMDEELAVGADTIATGRDGRGQMSKEMELINSLREENNILKERLSHLENTFAQRNDDFQSWMQWIESIVTVKKEKQI